MLATEKYGDVAAKHVCEMMKIQSQKDKLQLAEAKDVVYKEGFYHGVMSVGEFKGVYVS